MACTSTRPSPESPSAAPAGADDAALLERCRALEEDNRKLRRINEALIERVESINSRGDDAYAAFQHSVVLAEQVRERTDALNQAMAELKSSNQLLSDARLRAETAHQHLIDAIESISDAFVLFDREQRIVLFNSRFKALWAGSRVRIGSGLRLAEIKRLSRSTGLVVEEQRGHRDEHLLYRLRDGRWVQVSERPTREGGLVILYTDITEVKQSETQRREQALAQKSRLLQRAVDNLSQGMAMVNAEGQLELWNHRFLALCGLAPISAHRPFAEVMADSELALLTPASRDAAGQPIEELELRLFDGRMLEVRTHALPTGGFVNTFTDITERYRHAEALSESERWIRLITDHVPALIAYLNADLVYDFTNKVYEEWYCWPRGAMLGQSLRDVHSEEHCQRLAFNGDSSRGMYGLFNNPNVQSANSVVDWSTATNDEIVEDLRGLTRKVVLPVAGNAFADEIVTFLFARLSSRLLGHRVLLDGHLDPPVLDVLVRDVTRDSCQMRVRILEHLLV